MAKHHDLNSPDFNYDLVFKDFKTDGVVVIENLYNGEECDSFLKETLEAFKKINPELDYSDENVRKTWTKPNLPPQTRSGMFQSMIGHINPVNRVRENPKYKEIYREMYSRIKPGFCKETGNLISSIDGINIKPNLIIKF